MLQMKYISIIAQPIPRILLNLAVFSGLFVLSDWPCVASRSKLSEKGPKTLTNIFILLA